MSNDKLLVARTPDEFQQDMLMYGRAAMEVNVEALKNDFVTFVELLQLAETPQLDDFARRQLDLIGRAFQIPVRMLTGPRMVSTPDMDLYYKVVRRAMHRAMHPRRSRGYRKHTRRLKAKCRKAGAVWPVSTR